MNKNLMNEIINKVKGLVVSEVFTRLYEDEYVKTETRYLLVEKKVAEENFSKSFININEKYCIPADIKEKYYGFIESSQDVLVFDLINNGKCNNILNCYCKGAIDTLSNDIKKFIFAENCSNYEKYFEEIGFKYCLGEIIKQLSVEQIEDLFKIFYQQGISYNSAREYNMNCYSSEYGEEREKEEDISVLKLQLLQNFSKVLNNSEK